MVYAEDPFRVKINIICSMFGQGERNSSVIAPPYFTACLIVEYNLME